MIREPAQTVAVLSGVEVAVIRVPREDGSEVIVYGLLAGEQRSSRPSIVLLHGSGANSVFPQSGGRMSVPLLFGALCEVRHEWDVYFVEKRGIHFGDTLWGQRT